MKNIKLVLGESEGDRWWGLCEIDGEIYKIILWIGSAVKPTTALLMTSAWVSIEPGGSLYEPIEKAWREFHGEPSHNVTRQSTIDQIKSLVVDNQEAADEIAAVLDKYLEKKGGENV